MHKSKRKGTGYTKVHTNLGYRLEIQTSPSPCDIIVSHGAPDGVFVPSLTSHAETNATKPMIFAHIFMIYSCSLSCGSRKLWTVFETVSCMQQLCIAQLLFWERFVMMSAPSIKLCAIHNCCMQDTVSNTVHSVLHTAVMHCAIVIMGALCYDVSAKY